MYFCYIRGVIPVFYDNYIKLCNQAGKAPSFVAEEIGLKKSAVTSWKKGRTPTDANLQKIASYFGVAVESLIDKKNTVSESDTALPKGAEHIDLGTFHRIPILGRISAGQPLYAEQHIEGYTVTDLNGQAEYFALTVHGDSMNALGINDGYRIIVRRQDQVDNGEVAVVMVGDEDATVKRFYATGNTVTLMPQSTNLEHQPQIYDTTETKVRVIGKVVKVEFTL